MLTNTALWHPPWSFRFPVLHHSLCKPARKASKHAVQLSAAALHRQAGRHPIAIPKRGFAASAKTELCKLHQSGTRIATKASCRWGCEHMFSSASSLLRDVIFNPPVLCLLCPSALLRRSLYAVYPRVSHRLQEQDCHVYARAWLYYATAAMNNTIHATSNRRQRLLYSR